MIPEKQTTLSQTSFLRGSQRFEILSDGNLEYTFKRFSVYRQFKIPLWQIDPNSQRIKICPPGPLVGTVIFGVFLMVIIVGMFRADKGTAMALIIPLFLILAVLLTCVSKMRYMSVNCVAFPLRQGSQLHIWFDLPEPQIFKSFCETLAKIAEEAWHNRPLNSQGVGLADQIRELQKLRESKVLSDAEFELAKAKLLNNPVEGKIGFR